MHRQNLKKNIFFNQTNNILESSDKIKKFVLEIKFYFFSYFPENYSRRVRKSTNKKILA